MSAGWGLADFIGVRSGSWAREARGDSSSVVGAILRHIDGAGKLRAPQTRAIEAYLWLKFVGDGRRLADLVIGGVLRDDELAEEYNCRDPECRIYTAAQQFLLCFAGKNNLPGLRDAIRGDLTAKKTDWDKVARDLLHDFDYPNYFFSLPMGAGKTYLMAAFICLDLHFSRLMGEDSRFARNFVVFAPHAAKTAILPSLRTIREFNPEWILPPAAAADVRREMKVEVLDQPAAAKKSMRANNPNLARVNRLLQTRSRGLVFITNAEKVVLEKYAPGDGPLLRADKPEEKDRIEKSNELRARFAEIPALGVMLDEGVHAYSAAGEANKKLRDAVGIFHGGGDLRFVLGFSGTPFVKSKSIAGGVTVNLSRLQDVVYDFPLAEGIGAFLKKPTVVRRDDVREQSFIAAALDEFFGGYDIVYSGGAKSKIAFYCPNIKALNERILPAVKRWFARKRPGKEGEIFSYYSDATGDDKKYALPKSALADFHNLDFAHSPYRVVLLVAVGKEGWDCKSLTAVALPRKTTAANFVLQASCRCLREVKAANEESALIYLGEGNYEILDSQLRRQHDLTVAEFSRAAAGEIPVLVRKPALGALRYKQVRRRVKIVRRVESGGARLHKFKIGEFQKRYEYAAGRAEAGITAKGRLRQTNDGGANGAAIASVLDGDSPLLSSWRFLTEISRLFYGVFSAADLDATHGAALEKIRRALAKEAEWFANHPKTDMPLIAIREVAARIAGEDGYRVDTVAEDAEIELLEWRVSDPKIPHGTMMLPGIEKGLIRGYARHPERLDEEIEDDNLDPGDMSFNYAPYRFDSAFEKNALAAILQEHSQMPGVELYYNGMRREGDLASFYIETPLGRYTPDFLLLRREGGTRYRKQADFSPDKAAGEIEKVLIVETKAAVFYDEAFRRKEEFVKRDFLRHNPQMRYYCVVDKTGKNDFSAHLGDFRRVLREWFGAAK